MDRQVDGETYISLEIEKQYTLFFAFVKFRLS